MPVGLTAGGCKPQWLVACAQGKLHNPKEEDIRASILRHAGKEDQFGAFTKVMSPGAWRPHGLCVHPLIKCLVRAPGSCPVVSQCPVPLTARWLVQAYAQTQPERIFAAEEEEEEASDKEA